MPYNFDSIPDRRTSFFAIKWQAYPNDVLPMWVADMDFAAPSAIQKALYRFVEHGDMGYHLPSPALYESIAARMENSSTGKFPPK